MSHLQTMSIWQTRRHWLTLGLRQRILRSIAGVMLVLGCWAARAGAQAVQLPSMHYFGMSVDALVPDRGSMSLGGVNSAASGANQFGGLPGSRSRGSATGASGATVSVQIHDLDAMDEALLAEAARRRAAKDRFLAPGLVADTSGPDASVAQLKQERAQPKPTPQQEALEYFNRGRAAQAAGKAGAAKIYFQMAARRATGDLKQLADAQLNALSAPKTAAASRAPR